MSRINGEKARAAIARKRRSAQRSKDRDLKAKWLAKNGVAPATRTASAATPGEGATKTKRVAATKTPDQLVEELRPAKKRSGSSEKSE